MDEFDYVIVGAGAAGCVLANQLSADPDVSVLLIEAGSADLPPEVSSAPSWYKLLGGPADWAYQSVPQPGLNGRATHEPRGLGPGGSSNLYIMMHIRGHSSDFDHWAYQGAAGWSYADVLPYFTRLESQEDVTGPTTGVSGPQKVTNAGLHDPNPASRAFIDACTELGYPELKDFNSGDMYGTGWHHIDVVDGKRQGALASYLTPALPRPNLTLRTEAPAHRGRDVHRRGAHRSRRPAAVPRAARGDRVGRGDRVAQAADAVWDRPGRSAARGRHPGPGQPAGSRRELP
jgi:choline dehydrogenase